MFTRTRDEFRKEINSIKDAGLYKEERIILSDQKANIDVKYPEDAPEREVINFCANNYLGLANNPEIIQAAKDAMDTHGFGLSSVRFICGTQDLHKQLENRIADFFHTEDTILYSSCFDANGGLFETVLGKDDAIITDALNHASIIDGIRLCKAKRMIYKHSNMKELEEKLKAARAGKEIIDGKEVTFPPVKNIMIGTDGVFSMDGDVAKIDEIVALAEKYDAMVMVDDSHASGFFGETGRGSVEYCGMLGKVDVITSTLGKALGGASGGFTTGRKEIIEMLRQRSRPYLFSNTVAPAIVGAALKTFDLIEKSGDLRKKLIESTKYFRTSMQALGFDVEDGVHPIVPVLFRKLENDAQVAQQMAKMLYDEGIYAVGFYYPVVPKTQARIRVQISAAHSKQDIDKCIKAFEKTGKALGVI
ncbi:MAG TPA: glycine C-acetyltransferase [Ignavibacteria bacterium]|nr:glycine C-acetyltransferase [Ignavibacteria bacterium]